MDRKRPALTIAWVGAVLVPVTFLVVFFVYPVATIFGRGLWPHGHLDLSPMTRVLGDAGLRDVAWFTVWQAALSTALTLALALPGAYVLARYEFRGRQVVHAAVTVPFVLPTVVVGSAFLALLGERGPLGALGLTGTVWAILLAHVFFNYAVVVRVVGGLWSHLDPRQEDAARTLGASRAQVFLHVTLPALRPAIVAAASIVFLFTFTSFGVILVLGGPRFSTLETEIYRQTAQLLDLRTAAALSIIQLLAVVTLLGVATMARGRHAVALGLRPATEGRRRPRTIGARAFLAATLAMIVLVLAVPLGVLVQRSFATPNGPSLGFYRALSRLGTDSTSLVSPADAVRNSLAFAFATMLLALALGGITAVVIVGRERRRGRSARWLDGLVALPLGISAVTVGFGFLVTLDRPPLDLRTSWWLVPIAHALVAMPFVVWILVPVLRAIDPRLRDAATMLGASPARVWREIDLRIGARAALVAAGFAFAISLGEFGATAFIARPDRPTLPVVIYRLLGRPGPIPFGTAMAASVMLMLLTVGAVTMIERFRVAGAGEF